MQHDLDEFHRLGLGEPALAQKLSRSSRCGRLFAPARSSSGLCINHADFVQPDDEARNERPKTLKRGLENRRCMNADR
jgi:hypothetical protein